MTVLKSVACILFSSPESIHYPHVCVQAPFWWVSAALCSYYPYGFHTNQKKIILFTSVQKKNMSCDVI